MSSSSVYTERAAPEPSETTGALAVIALVEVCLILYVARSDVTLNIQIICYVSMNNPSADITELIDVLTLYPCIAIIKRWIRGYILFNYTKQTNVNESLAIERLFLNYQLISIVTEAIFVLRRRCVGSNLINTSNQIYSEINLSSILQGWGRSRIHQGKLQLFSLCF